MELEKCISERRSIRKYTDRPVSKEDIVKLIEAARKSTILEKFSSFTLLCSNFRRVQEQSYRLLARF